MVIYFVAAPGHENISAQIFSHENFPNYGISSYHPSMAFGPTLSPWPPVLPTFPLCLPVRRMRMVPGVMLERSFTSPGDLQDLRVCLVLIRFWLGTLG